MKTNYLLKAHHLYRERVIDLKEQVTHLRGSLSRETFCQHEVVKFAARLRRATLEVIPEDPNRPDYRLKGNLRKFRRYKQGLQRYRLFFASSNEPPVVLYLYVNDRKHLRKDGDKNDPYEVFAKLVKKGVFSSDPSDSKMAQWISDLSGAQV